MGDERYVQVRERAVAYAAWYEKERVTAHITENCREEAKQILAQADRLMAHTFSFEDRWDMEPCREPFTLKEMIWDRSPNGDPEWIFMLNRHEYMNKLLIAGWLTGDTSYAEKLKWFLLHWIQANPILPEGTVTTRTIDTGIRCMSWQYLLLHLLGEGLIEEREAGENIRSATGVSFRRHPYAAGTCGFANIYLQTEQRTGPGRNWNVRLGFRCWMTEPTGSSP